MPISISGAPTPPSNITLISDETLSGAGNFAAVTIPTGYRTIQVEYSGETTTLNRSPLMTFNSDGGANYNTENINGTAGAVAAGATAGGTSIALGYQVGAVPHYANVMINNDATLKKNFVYSVGGSDRTDFGGGYWNNTNAITTINVTASSGDTFKIGSRLRVWGYK